MLPVNRVGVAPLDSRAGLVDPDPKDPPDSADFLVQQGSKVLWVPSVPLDQPGSSVPREWQETMDLQDV